MTPQQIESFWAAKPFPHLIIDGFLPASLHESMTHKLNYVNSRPSLSFNNNIEKAKEAFDPESQVGEILRPVVDSLCGEFLGRLAQLIDIVPTPLPNIISPDTPYKYFHRHTQGGYLGPHVDHSQLHNTKGEVTKTDVHVLNCIYYLNTTQGGATTLFGPTGWGKPKTYVPSQANRLLIFLHTSTSFHGMSTLHDPERYTVYMDYYIRPSIVRQDKWWRHPTTFVPKDPATLHKYLPGYLRWMMRRKLV